MSDMKYFMKEWKFFNEQLSLARNADRRSMLCGLDPIFCENVIMKTTKILGAPTAEALDTPLEKLCGGTYADRFYAMVDIEESLSSEYPNTYRIELACVPTDGMPAHYILAVPKEDFDRFLTIMMSYIDPTLMK